MAGSTLFSFPYRSVSYLDLETLRSSTTTSTLKLSALAFNVWLLQWLLVYTRCKNLTLTYLVLVWSHAKVLECLAGVLWSTKQNDVRTGWCTEGELVKSQAFSAGLDDTSTSCCGKTKSADAELRNFKQTVVVQNSGDNGNSLALTRLLGCWVLGCSNNLRQRHLFYASVLRSYSVLFISYWWSVGAAHAQSAKHNLVEV